MNNGVLQGTGCNNSYMHLRHRRFNKNVVEIRAWLSDYTRDKIMGVILYSWFFVLMVWGGSSPLIERISITAKIIFRQYICNLLIEWKRSIQPEGQKFWPDNALTDVIIWASSQYKDRLSWYKDFHNKEETVVGSSYLYTVNLYTVTTTSLYWNGPLPFAGADVYTNKSYLECNQTNPYQSSHTVPQAPS